MCLCSYLQINFHSIDEKAIIDKYTKFDGKYIGKRAYIGIFNLIGARSEIGEAAVVHEYVSLPSNSRVNPTDIVIQTPTSFHLYRMSAQTIPADEYVHHLRSP